MPSSSSTALRSSAAAAATSTALPLTQLRRTLEQQRESLAKEAELNVRRLEVVCALLSEVQAAVGRLDNGTYGLCRECWQSVPVARLLLQPHVRYCTSCEALISGPGAGAK